MSIEIMAQKLKEFFKQKLVIQLVLFMVIILCALVIFSVIYKKSIDKTQIINNSLVKQTSEAIALGSPVKWTVFVKRSDINSKQRFIKLPKTAQDIKIRATSVKQAEEILSSSKFRSSTDQKEFFASIKNKKSLLAQAGEAVTDSQLSPAEPEIIKTSDATIVDLSSQMLVVDTDDQTPVESTESESVESTDSTNSTELVEPTEQTIEQSVDATSSIVIEQDPTSSTTETDIGSTTESLQPIGFSGESLVTVNFVNTSSSSSSTVSSVATSTATTTLNEIVQIDYTTPAPQIATEETDTGKLVKVFVEDEDTDMPLVDVVASTTIPRIFKIGEENKIQIKWKNNEDQKITFKAYDSDSDSYLDYVEWTIPHLSEQIFEITFNLKAFILNSDQKIVSNIYSEIQKKDNDWALLSDSQHLRFIFNKSLTQKDDISIYAKRVDSEKPASIEVYPVYKDQGENIKEDLPVIMLNIGDENTYKVILTDLGKSTNTFDIKIIGNIEVDFLSEPAECKTISDGNWSDGSKWAGCSSGNGAIPTDSDNVTINNNIVLDTDPTITNLTISSGGALEAGSYTITLRGNWDSSLGNFTADKSTLKVESSDGVLSAKDNSIFYKLAISEGASVYVDSAVSINYYFNNSLVVDGILNLGGTILSAKKGSSPKTFIGKFGKLTGNGEFIPINWPKSSGAGIAGLDEGGIIDVKKIKILHPRQDSILSPGNYSSEEVYVGDEGEIRLSAGNYIFQNNVTLENSKNGDLIIDNETNSPNVTINGSLIYKIPGSQKIILKNSTRNIIKGGVVNYNKDKVLLEE